MNLGLISVKKPELYEAALAAPSKYYLLECLGHETLLNRELIEWAMERESKQAKEP